MTLHPHPTCSSHPQKSCASTNTYWATTATTSKWTCKQNQTKLQSKCPLDKPIWATHPIAVLVHQRTGNSWALNWTMQGLWATSGVLWELFALWFWCFGAAFCPHTMHMHIYIYISLTESYHILSYDMRLSSMTFCHMCKLSIILAFYCLYIYIIWYNT